MMNQLFKNKTFNSMLVAASFLLASGSLTQVSAQRDPFAKSPATQPRVASSGPVKSGSSSSPNAKPKPSVPVPVVAPGIEDRIAYYKRMREAAALSNQPIPKVTSVLTLDEMSIVGIFRTPRGYAAMVEAKPIKLSYTVYPGEKFFDGQLVAIEENKLVFRKVTKMTNGKFITGEENKTLREYTVKDEVQGTAPSENTAATTNAADKTEAAANQTPSTVVEPGNGKAKTPAVVSSPLEELNRQATESAKDSTKPSAKNKKGKKQTSSIRKSTDKNEKVAANQDQ